MFQNPFESFNSYRNFKQASELFQNNPFTEYGKQAFGKMSEFSNPFELFEQWQKMENSFAQFQPNTQESPIFENWKEFLKDGQKYAQHVGGVFSSNIATLTNLAENLSELFQGDPTEIHEKLKNEEKVRDIFGKASTAFFRSFIDSNYVAWVSKSKNFIKNSLHSTGGFSEQLGNRKTYPTFGPYAQHIDEARDGLLLWRELTEKFVDYVSEFDGLEENVRKTFVDDCLKKGAEAEKIMDYYDLWVKSFEKEFRNLTARAEYSIKYGEFTNASLKVRNYLQKKIDEYVEALGLPSKKSTDTMLGQISRLKKENRNIMRELKELKKTLQDNTATNPSTENKSTAKPRITPAKKSASNKTGKANK